jgi:hypothetical protein
MGKIGKISIIKKDYNDQYSLEGSLASRGRYKYPTTGHRLVPYKEKNGSYRTGLDENALYIKAMPIEEQKIEKARVKAEKARLEETFGKGNLEPKSPYYVDMFDGQYGQSTRAKIVMLGDGDTIFDLDDHEQAVTYAWVRVHPDIAPSYQHWLRGDVNSSDVQFYVNDENEEAEVAYKKSSTINKAIIKMESLSLSEKRKVARLMGLPITDESPESLVYSELDKVIRSSEISFGKHKGSSPIDLFNTFAYMKKENLQLKDFVHQLFTHSVYRLSSGKVFDGTVNVFESEDALVEFLVDPKNQTELFALEERLKAKKSIHA